MMQLDQQTIGQAKKDVFLKSSFNSVCAFNKQQMFTVLKAAKFKLILASVFSALSDLKFQISEIESWCSQISTQLVKPN